EDGIRDLIVTGVQTCALPILDSCVITDGGGALVVVHPDVAKDLPRTTVKVLGHGEAPKHTDNGRIDLTHTGAVWSGPRAFEEARSEERRVGKGLGLDGRQRVK